MATTGESLARNRKRRGISAWLVTWEHTGNHAKPPRRVAAVYSSRWGANRVKELVELLYLGNQYEISEQIAYVRNPGANPYPAKFGSLRGTEWQGEIHCGHNPWLYARLVENLRTEDGGDEGEQVLWDESPKPNLDLLNEAGGPPGSP